MGADEKTCPFCAEPVKAGASVCKHCGKKLKKSLLWRLFKWGCIGFVLMSVLVVIAGRDGDRSPTFSSSNSSAPSAVPFPAQQQAFIDAIQNAVFDFRNGKNEIQQEQARDKRRAAIQNALDGDARISGWIGKVKSVSTNSDGKGILDIVIAPDISISTSNNALSDIGIGSLIEKDSSLYYKLADLARNNSVKFSGAFVPNQRDFVHEKSITIRGSMTDPNFMFVFSSIEKQ